MAELEFGGLPNFWQQKRPEVSVESWRRRGPESDYTSTVASTTDDMNDVKAAAAYYGPEGDADNTVTYTEIAKRENPEFDGSTEHGPVNRYVNGRLVTEMPEGPDVVLGPPNPTFGPALSAVCKLNPAINEAMSPNVAIVPEVQEFLGRHPDSTVATMVAVDLALHRYKLDELRSLPGGQPRLKKLQSWALEQGLNGPNPDKLAQRQYRAVRDANKWR